MSLEIRSIGEVISYQATPRTEFVVGMGVVKSKTSENESITFNIIQFIPVDAEDPCYVTSKISLDPSSIPHDFTYVTAIGAIASKPNITETTVSFDVSLSQYVKTNTGVSPPSSRRTTVVRSIAEQSPPPKKPKLVNSSTTLSSTTASETESSGSMQIEDINPNEGVSNDTQQCLHQSNQTKRLNPGEQPYEI
ncbi:7241_t:CDS:2 [Paraglomus brasilianum]|uniref:7241_t:CDS:1 n=1 Tax=Paraglomus brasilianum TaxID=144538 RepID=A0A9N8W7M8_9GLOM|nr:7241_t:CDS:2 [Paraglomus brasilianum]